MTEAKPGFETLDWMVLVGYFAILAISAKFFTRKQSNTEDYFLGGRSMPAWAVALSVLATSLSAATFIGAPQKAYLSDLTYLSSNIGAVIGVFLIAWLFIPTYYKAGVSTVYEYIGKRFGHLGLRSTSLAFLIGRTFASGARIYIAALPGSMIIFGDISPIHLTVSVLILGFVGIIYTLSGGITSVIYSDCLQIFVFLTAAIVACIILLDRIPADVSSILSILNEDHKLTWLKSGFSGEHGFDITDNYTLITSLTGFVLFNMAAYGTDQDLTQRMLTCKNSWSGSKSAIQAILLGLPVTFIFMSLGLLLYIFYQKPELMGGATPAQVDDSRKVFLHFILTEMPVGMAGLMMAGLFAAGLSSLNSALNAMASSVINDHYRHMVQRDETHYLKAGRLMVVMIGFLLCGMAMLCIQLQKDEGGMALVDFALYVMVFAYSGLLGVFLCARFTNRGNGVSSLLALIAGFICILFMQPDFQFWVSQPEDLFKIAFPWQMLISASLAFFICCIPPSTTPHE